MGRRERREHSDVIRDMRRCSGVGEPGMGGEYSRRWQYSECDILFGCLIDRFLLLFLLLLAFLPLSRSLSFHTSTLRIALGRCVARLLTISASYWIWR